MKRAAKRKWKISRKKSGGRQGRRKRKLKQRLKLVRGKTVYSTKSFRSATVNKMLDESNTKGYQEGYKDGQVKLARTPDFRPAARA